MSNSNPAPADGTNTVAAAQVIKHRLLVLRDSEDFPTFDSVRSGQVLQETLTQVNNLPSLKATVYQFPEYQPEGQGGPVYLARPSFEWRLVGLAGPDLLDPNALFSSFIPISPPLLMIPGVPVTFSLSCCWHYEQVAIQVRKGSDPPDEPAPPDGALQGQDFVSFLIGASQ
jgi:hypothetical protein